MGKHLTLHNNPIEKTRIPVSLSDGGTITLQAVIRPEIDKFILLVPGLTSTGDDLYVINMMQAAIDKDYNVVVVNH